MKFPWLTDVDVVGISAYYSVSTPEDRSLEYMKKAWLSKIEILEQTHKYYNKPVMFAEIGVRNERGCTMYPYDFIHRPELPLDEEEQADFYESAMWQPGINHGLPAISGGIGKQSYLLRKKLMKTVILLFTVKKPKEC